MERCSMMKRKGVIRIAMIALCMAAFGGCGKQEQTVTDNGGKEPVTLDWYVIIPGLSPAGERIWSPVPLRKRRESL